MKKLILMSLVALAAMACNGNKQGTDTDKTGQWKEALVGKWVNETLADSAGQQVLYVLAITINDDGSMTESDNNYFFSGKWTLSNDTLYKEGYMSPTTGEGQADDAEKPEKNIRGYMKLLNVTTDSLLAADLSGNTVVFKKQDKK